MTHQVLLVSRDSNLAERVRRALPAAIPTELLQAEQYRPTADPRGWLLVLLDAKAFAAGGDASADADPIAAGGAEAPTLWLSARPRIVAGEEIPAGFAAHLVDYLDRNEAPSKLAFILHQHLTAGYLRRMRLPPAGLRPGGGDELRRQINNDLTGILGNAALAMDASGRVPAALGARLQRIADLATHMRDLLRALPEPGDAHPMVAGGG